MKVIAQYTYTNKHAGPKAKIDIERILKKHFDADIKPFRCKHDADTALQKFVYRTRKAIYMLKNRIGSTDVLVIQHPFSKKTDIPFSSNKRIALVHDIDGLRNGNKAMERAEISVLNTCDVVISHNPKMTEYLKSHGLKTKTVDLGIFDYLSDGDASLHKNNFETPTIVYAGNISKSEFVNTLDINKINYTFNLYGVGIDSDPNEKMCFKGAFSPDELPDRLEGDIGLVWDGAIDSSDADTGFKRYTIYNNPHKLSCYIAAALPVIVWDKSAAADFVMANNIGYVISSLYDINSIDFSDYHVKAENAYRLSNKVRSGEFAKNAMEAALSQI